MNAISYTLTKLAEERLRLEQALIPSRAMAGLIEHAKRLHDFSNLTQFAKPYQQPTYLTAAAEIARAMQPSAHFTAVSQMVRAMDEERRLRSELVRASSYADGVIQQIARLRTSSEAITAPYHAFHEMMSRQSGLLDSLSARVTATERLSFGISQVSQAILACEAASTGLARRMSDVGLLAARESLSTRLFAVPNAYAEFVRQTMDRLAASSSPTVAMRLRASLNLAEYQLQGITSVIGAFMAVPDDEEEPLDIRDLSVPFTQQDELLTNTSDVGDENNTEALIAISPTATTAERAHRVLGLVTLCNEAGKTSAQGIDFFKPTTRMLTAFSEMPWLAATNRSQFGEVIDYLYFIFYEGAGQKNLRFLDEQGGPLTVSDCDLIWCIKHLRNKWSRHDADHGRDQEIRKSWAELAKKFKWLGLAVHPTQKHHFQQLHIKLLELAEEFLRLLLSKLTLS